MSSSRTADCHSPPCIVVAPGVSQSFAFFAFSVCPWSRVPVLLNLRSQNSRIMPPSNEPVFANVQRQLQPALAQAANSSCVLHGFVA